MNAERLLQHFDRIADAPDAIAHLRRFILDLAVRGKLVDQDPNDEPASELLKRIQIEKERLVKEGEIKKQKPLLPIAMEDEPFSIPKNWCWVKLHEITSYIQRGKSPKYATHDGFPVISQKCLQWDGLNLSAARIVTEESIKSYEKIRFLQNGDLLWNSTGTGTIGRIIRLNAPQEKLICDSHVTVVRCLGVEPEFIRTWLRSDHVYGVIESKATGATNQVELTAQMTTNQAVPLPPLAEQHRIVAKVDELMGLCDRLESAQKNRESQRDRLVAASLHHLNQSADGDRTRFYFNHLSSLTVRSEHIKELRQTILNLAVRGKLVPQNPDDEHSLELLKRIQIEKLRSEKAGLLKKDKSVWEGLPKEAPYTLPSQWIWTHLQDIFEISRGGSPRPAGDPRYFGGSIPWITVREITKDSEKYLLKTETGLTEEGSTKSRFINPGDLLLTNSGATLGVPKISKIKGCMNDGVAVLRLFHTENVNDFAFLYLNSQTQAFRQINQGMGQPNLNTPIIAGWFFPLPPLAEQHRIVAKVDELMGLCDRLETQLSTTQTNSRRLLESLLHEVIAGTL